MPLHVGVCTPMYMYLIRVHVGKAGMSVLLHLSTSIKNISLYGEVIIFFPTI